MRFPGRNALALAVIAGLGIALAAPVEVVVKPKDTLYSIAKANGTTVEELRALNYLSSDALAVGQKLIVKADPAPAATPSQDSAYETITVAPGQTLYSIAKAHGMSVAEVIVLNKLPGDQVSAGQQVRVPRLASSPAAPAVNPAPTVAASSQPAVAASSTLAAASPTQPALPAVNIKPSLPPTPAAPAPMSASAAEHPLWPVSGVITQGYSASHNGIDIAAPIGTPIYAAISGTVAFSGWDNTGYGQRVVVNGVDGLTYSYAHASKLLVTRGQVVRQGDVIALVGSTGNSTGPHLHFHVVTSGARTISPMAVLPQSRVQLASTAARRGR